MCYGQSSGVILDKHECLHYHETNLLLIGAP
jgi:hypothetical protein